MITHHEWSFFFLLQPAISGPLRDFENEINCNLMQINHFLRAALSISDSYYRENISELIFLMKLF